MQVCIYFWNHSTFKYSNSPCEIMSNPLKSYWDPFLKTSADEEEQHRSLWPSWQWHQSGSVGLGHLLKFTDNWTQSRIHIGTAVASRIWNNRLSICKIFFCREKLLGSGIECKLLSLERCIIEWRRRKRFLVWRKKPVSIHLQLHLVTKTRLPANKINSWTGVLREKAVV